MKSIRLLGAIVITALSAMAQIGALSPLPIQQPLDNSGHTIPGGCLYTYKAGTTTAQLTYSDAGLTTPNANPIVLDSSGRAPAIYLSSISYKFVLAQKALGGCPGSPGTVIWSQDNVSSVVAFQQVGGVTTTVQAALRNCPFDVQYISLATAIANIPAYGCLNVVGTWTPATNIAVSAANISIHCQPGSQINAGSGTLTSNGILLFSGANQTLSGCQFKNPSALVALEYIRILPGATKFTLIDNSFDGNLTATGAVLWDGQTVNPTGVQDGLSRRNTYANIGPANTQSSVAEQVNNPTNLKFEDEIFNVINGDAIHIFMLGNTLRTDAGGTYTASGTKCTLWTKFCIEETDYNVASYTVQGTVCDNPGKTGAGCLSLTPGPALSHGVINTSGTAVSWVSGNTFNTDGSWNGQPISISGFRYYILSVASTTSLTLVESAGVQNSVPFIAPYQAGSVKIVKGTVRDNHGTAYYTALSGSSCFELDSPNTLIEGNSCTGNWSQVFSLGGGGMRIIGNTGDSMYNFFSTDNPSWISGRTNVFENNLNINSCVGFVQTASLSVKDNWDIRNPGACPADLTPLGGGHNPYQSILFKSDFNLPGSLPLPLGAVDGNRLVIGTPLNGFDMATWGTNFDWYGFNAQHPNSYHANALINNNALAVGLGYAGGANETNSVMDANTYTNLGSIGSTANINITYHHNQSLYGYNQPYTFSTGTTTNGSKTITTATTAGMAVGQTITGTGIPASSVITSMVGGSSITMNNAATASGTPALTVTGPAMDFTIQAVPDYTLPTVTLDTGAGAGATYRFLTDSTTYEGILEVTTAGTPAAGGHIAVMTMPYASLRYFAATVYCNLTNATAIVPNWNFRVMTNPQWGIDNNGSALTTGQAYRIGYSCIPNAFPYLQ